MNEAVAVAAIVMGVIAVLGLCAGVFRWFVKLEANTTATERLTDAFKSVGVHMDSANERLFNHEIRLTKLESKNEAKDLRAVIRDETHHPETTTI